MLVKIRPGVYINPDNVIAVELIKENGNYLISFADAIGNIKALDCPLFSIAIPALAASYLIEIMEVADAVILPGESGYVDYSDPKHVTSQPLTSRIAQLLRDELTQGATFGEVRLRLDGDDGLAYDALSALIKERVVFNLKSETRGVFLYYHALHAPREHKAEEKEIDLLPLLPNSTATILRNGELECVSCEHQSCATCVTAQACHVCGQPNFTPKEVLADCVTCGQPPSAPLHDPKFGNHLFGEPIRTNPDPLGEGVTLESRNPAANTATIASRTSSDLCDLCGYRRSSRIHLDSCVPLGVME